MVGSPEQGPREVIWYLAKTVPNPARNEPVNIGIILRLAESEELTYRFDGPRDWARDPKVWSERVAKWTGILDKYGPECLRWLPNRKLGDPFYVELAGRDIRPGRVDFDALYNELVAPRMEYAPKVIHRLRHGLAVCMFSKEVPGRWPAGHLWAREEDLGKVNCRVCAEAGEFVSRETKPAQVVGGTGGGEKADIILPDPVPPPQSLARPVGLDGVLHDDIVKRRDDLIEAVEECENTELAGGMSRLAAGKPACRSCNGRLILVEELELMLPEDKRLQGDALGRFAALTGRGG